MSQENVEVVRRSVELFSDGDLDGWVQAWAPDVVVTPPEGWPEGEVNGIEAWRRQAERLRDSWAEARAEVDDIRPVGEDRVLLRLRYVTRGKETGMSFDTPVVAILDLHGGKITRGRYFWDYAQALEAAGLSE